MAHQSVQPGNKGVGSVHKKVLTDEMRLERLSVSVNNILCEQFLDLNQFASPHIVQRKIGDARDKIVGLFKVK